jgi:hypothetical protein
MSPVELHHSASCRHFALVCTRALTVALAVLILGWGLPSRAAPPSPADPLQELRAQDLRVASVSYRLALANKAFCPDATAPQPGFTLHGLEQYEVADRERVSAGFALGRHVGIMAVVPFSPAQKAGLTAGDQLVAVNGRALAVAELGERPTRAFVEQAEKIISGRMKSGEVTLRVSSAGAFRDVRFVPELGCASNVELLPGHEVNAWADGRRVVISAGLVARCDTDDDLALVIAHELAHNLLRHGARLAAGTGARDGVMRLLGSGSGSATMRETEEEADRLAVVLTSTASYDLARAEQFMSGLLDRLDAASTAETHPDADRRLMLLRAEIANARDPSPDVGRH